MNEDHVIFGCGVEIHDVHDERVTYEGHHHGSSQLEHHDFMTACESGEMPAVSVHDGLLAVAVRRTTQTVRRQEGELEARVERELLERRGATPETA